ncbi:phage major capsid protein, P2 family [Dyella sp. ASV21]|uniref:phage major capsid protein, P2 family n=1 Tax=Dyella sp. ASV21 TaxID=2795114 RepID=UPI0018EC3490|nr:phage major capsid protein, P2 family [Dyella sp. ASV21]
MQNPTRLVFNQLTARIAELNSVPDATVQFSVEPTIQQRLETAIQESSAFLQMINMPGVTEASGEKLRLGPSGPIASRTDTNTKDRNPRNVSDLKSRKYQCAQTNFDTAFPYALLDAWAKFQDFQTRLSIAIAQRQALDRIMIGWNGIKVADETDLSKYPMLEDVNKGWLQNLREQAPARVMSRGKTEGKVRVGPGGDYANLDALVYDAMTLLDPWYQEDTGLRVIVGRKLMHDKYFPTLNRDQRATDELASQLLVSQRSIGGLSGLVVPFFPATSILITRPDNLSIYYQTGGRRRQMIDEPKRNRIANYESSNDAYVVEDNGLAVLVENIEFGDWSKG